MARYPTKRSTGRVTSKYFKKKTPRRVHKKGSGSTARHKALVKEEVRKILNSGEHNEKQKITLEAVISDPEIHANGKRSGYNTLRIPVTAAVPPQAASPDQRRRKSNNIVVSKVAVRGSLSVLEETRVMLVIYEPHGSVQAKLNHLPMDLHPTAAEGRVPETFKGEFQPFTALGMASQHGPLMVRKKDGGLTLDTTDQTPFGCRVSTHAGKPLGAIWKKKFGGGLRKTTNWSNQGNVAQVGLGAAAWTTHEIKCFWEPRKTYTYMYEGMNTPCFDRNMEIFLYIDCPTEDGAAYPDEVALVGAKVGTILVDVYFHEL